MLKKNACKSAKSAEKPRKNRQKVAILSLGMLKVALSVIFNNSEPLRSFPVVNFDLNFFTCCYYFEQ